MVREKSWAASGEGVEQSRVRGAPPTVMVGKVKAPQATSCWGRASGGGVGEGVGLAMAKLPSYSTPGQPNPRFTAEETHSMTVQHWPWPTQLAWKLIWLAEEVTTLLGSGKKP